MDARHLAPFSTSICNTFETMCGLPVTLRQPKLKASNEPPADVSGIIGFSGDAVGSVVLHFSFDAASKIATSFVGTRITPDHADFAETIGELAGMVAGGAKAQFHGLDIFLSLPTVIVGADHCVSASKASTRIVIPCDTESAGFFVEVGMVVLKVPAAVGAD